MEAEDGGMREEEEENPLKPSKQMKEELNEEFFTDKLMEQRMLGGPGAGGKHFVHRLGDYCTGHGCPEPRPNASASPNVWSDNIKVHRT